MPFTPIWSPLLHEGTDETPREELAREFKRAVYDHETVSQFALTSAGRSRMQL